MWIIDTGFHLARDYSSYKLDGATGVSLNKLHAVLEMGTSHDKIQVASLHT